MRCFILMNDKVSNNLALIHIFIYVQAYNTPAVDDKQQMFLSNKVTGSVRGQYRHEVQSTEMIRDFVESKGSTNLGYSNAISRFWIRSSVDFKILQYFTLKSIFWAERPTQWGLFFRVWTKMYHLMDHFVEFFRMPMYTHRCESSRMNPYVAADSYLNGQGHKRK